MPFRFRKYFKIAPGIKINLSKSGLSTSIGKSGASLNLGKRGVRSTIGLPGTGLSFSKLLTTSDTKPNASSDFNISSLPTEDGKGNGFSSSPAPSKGCCLISFLIMPFNILINLYRSLVNPETRRSTIILVSSITGACLLLFGVSNALDTTSPTSAPTAVLSLTPTSVAIIPAPTFIQSATSPAQNNRCVPASQQQIETIRIGIKDIDTNNDIQTAWAVKSNDFENIWFVAAEIQGPGILPKQAVGIWAISGDPATPGTILSVDGFAKQFSIYPDGATTDAQITMNDDGVQEVVSCAQTVSAFSPVPFSNPTIAFTKLPTSTSTSLVAITPTTFVVTQPTQPPSGGYCCRICGANSQPCGDTCISLKYTCSKPPGCACK